MGLFKTRRAWGSGQRCLTYFHIIEVPFGARTSAVPFSVVVVGLPACGCLGSRVCLPCGVASLLREAVWLCSLPRKVSDGGVSLLEGGLSLLSPVTSGTLCRSHSQPWGAWPLAQS